MKSSWVLKKRGCLCELSHSLILPFQSCSSNWYRCHTAMTNRHLWPKKTNEYLLIYRTPWHLRQDREFRIKGEWLNCCWKWPCHLFFFFFLNVVWEDACLYKETNSFIWCNCFYFLNCKRRFTYSAHAVLARNASIGTKMMLKFV